MGTHGSLVRLSSVGGNSLTDLIPEDRLNAIVDRTRNGHRDREAPESRRRLLHAAARRLDGGFDLTTRKKCCRGAHIWKASTASTGSMWDAVQAGRLRPGKGLRIKLNDAELGALQKSARAVQELWT